MRENGVVRKIVNGRAYVLVKRDVAACCVGCKLCSAKEGATAEVEVAAVPGLQPRDEVTIEIPSASPLKASVILFLAPMLLLVGFTIAGQLLLAKGEAGQVSLPSVGLGLAAMFLWYAGVWWHDRRARPQQDRTSRIIAHHPPAEPLRRRMHGATGFHALGVIRHDHGGNLHHGNLGLRIEIQ